MYKINLEIAKNGIIKTITDDNYNSAGGQFEDKIVYDLDDDSNNNFEKTCDFLYSVFEDLGLELGGARDRQTLRLVVDFGEEYIKTEDEIKRTIKDHTSQIKDLKEELRILTEFNKK